MTPLGRRRSAEGEAEVLHTFEVHRSSVRALWRRKYQSRCLRRSELRDPVLSEAMFLQTPASWRRKYKNRYLYRRELRDPVLSEAMFLQTKLRLTQGFPGFVIVL